MTRERAEAWADALGRELVTTDPAVHAALTAIASGLDEMLREKPRVLVLSREDKDWLWRES